MRSVILGSKTYLHTGLHGALTDEPPSDVRYDIRDGGHLALMPNGERAIFDDLSIGEAVDFGAARHVVHSAYFPVLNSRAWIVDTDHLIFPTVVGDYIYAYEFRRNQATRATRSAEFQRAVTARMARMLRAYAHDSCKAILFHTRSGMTRSQQMVRWFAGDGATAILAKMILLTPALPRLELAGLEKWDERAATTVVFCGRWFVPKKGELALRVMARLLARFPHVGYLYIGPIPPGKSEEYGAVLGRIEHYPAVSRSDVAAILARAHILLHPSIGENVGAIFAEAATAGVAIVAARDCSEHLSDWFGGGGATLIDREGLTSEAEENGFFDAVSSLVLDRGAAASMGRFNHSRAREGLFSVEARNRVLDKLYDRASAAASQPLSVVEFAGDFTGAIRHLTPDQFIDARTDFLSREGIRGAYFDLDIDF